MLAEDSIAFHVDSLTTDSIQKDSVVEDSLPHVVLITDSMPHVVIWQDSSIHRLLYQRAAGAQSALKEVPGYRVQIYSSNRSQTAKNEAIQLEQEMAKQLQEPIYVIYISPFWKVRIGDFKTYEEASEYKRVIVTQWPQLIGDTYVVRDQITVNK